LRPLEGIKFKLYSEPNLSKVTRTGCLGKWKTPPQMKMDFPKSEPALFSHIRWEPCQFQLEIQLMLGEESQYKSTIGPAKKNVAVFSKPFEATWSVRYNR